MIHEAESRSMRRHALAVWALLATAIVAMLFVVGASYYAQPELGEVAESQSFPHRAGTERVADGDGLSRASEFFCYDLPPYVAVLSLGAMVVATALANKKEAIPIVLGWLLLLGLEIVGLRQWLLFQDFCD